MKKIIAMLLAVTLIFSGIFVLSACGDETCTEHIDENSDNKCDNCDADLTPPPTVDEALVAFVTAMEATKPATLSVTVTTKFGSEDLVSTYNTVYSSKDASFTVTYCVQSVNSSLEGEDIIEKEGTITCKADGTYSDNGSFAGSNPSATGVKANLTSEKLTDYTVSADGDTLTATVKAADSLDILGAEYENDASLVIVKNEGKIVSVTLSSGEGADFMKVVCIYG